MKKAIITLPILVIAIYILSPYYSTWKIIQAVKTGSAEQMQTYIDFPKVKDSIKQQMNLAVEQQVEEDPMAGAMLKAFMPMMDQAVDELIHPERMAEFIQKGKLQSGKRSNLAGIDSKLKAMEDAEKIELSWFAFFENPSRFRISVNDLTLYLDLQDWHWQMTAVGMKDLMKHDKSKKKKEFVADDIDRNSPPTPVVIDDIESVREDVAAAFLITSDYNNEIRIEGDFNHMPSRGSFNPTVVWTDVVDSDGKSVLGQYSAEKQAERERFNIGDQYYLGKWSGTIPKLDGSNKAASASGICNLETPTLIQSYSLGKEQVKKIQIQSQSAVNLSSLENGSVSLSYYVPVELGEMEPTIIIRNAAGEPLKQTGSSSMTSKEPVVDARFNQPMSAKSLSIRISGTPEKVELYFALDPIKIEVPVTAETKPEIVSGVLNKPIKHARLIKAKPELPIKVMDIETLKNAIDVSFHEKTNYDKTKARYLKLLLPAVANSAFASLDYTGLNALLNGKPIEGRPSRNHSHQNRYSVEYVESNQSLTNVNFDELRGTVSIKYPASIEIFTLKQGETSHNATLDGLTATFPVGGDIPDYYSYFDTRSIIALDKKDRQISYLYKEPWSKEVYKIFFWGEPDRVEIKRVTKWIELELPVNINADDLVYDK